MGNLSGTPSAPSNPTIPTAPAAPKGVTGSVSPKAVVSPATPKNVADPQIPAKPSMPVLPGLPGLPSLPKPPTGTTKPSLPAKPSAPTAPTGKGIHFGGRRKKRTRRKQRGGYKIHYNKQKEYEPFAKRDFTIGESVIIKGDGKKRSGFISSIQPFGVQLSRRRKNGQYEGLQFYPYNEIKSVRRARQKKKPKSAAKTGGGQGRRRRSRKKRNQRRGGGFFDFFRDPKKKKQTRKEKEARKKRNMDAMAEQRFKLRLAAAAEQDYLASTKQEGIPNIERMAKMRTAARTAWEHFMTTDNYKKFLYETWKVNWSGVPPTEEEMQLIRSLKRYDPAGYRAVQRRDPPAQHGGKHRRKTRRRRKRR